MNENYQSLIESQLKDEPKPTDTKTSNCNDLNEFLDNSSQFLLDVFDFSKKPILNPKLMNDFREQELKKTREDALVDDMCKQLKLSDHENQNINFHLSKSSSSSSFKYNENIFSNHLNQDKDNQVSPIAKSQNNSNEFDLSNNQPSEPSGYYFILYFTKGLQQQPSSFISLKSFFSPKRIFFRVILMPMRCLTS